MEHEPTRHGAQEAEHAIRTLGPGQFVTDYLTLATYLSCRGHDLSIEGTRSRTVLFAFESSSELQTDLQTFRRGSACVEPVRYDAARVELRRRMDECRGGR